MWTRATPLHPYMSTQPSMTVGSPSQPFPNLDHKQWARSPHSCGSSWPFCAAPYTGKSTQQYGTPFRSLGKEYAVNYFNFPINSAQFLVSISTKIAMSFASPKTRSRRSRLRGAVQPKARQRDGKMGDVLALNKQIHFLSHRSTEI